MTFDQLYERYGEAVEKLSRRWFECETVIMEDVLMTVEFSWLRFCTKNQTFVNLLEPNKCSCG